MKIESYQSSGACPPLWKQHCIVGISDEGYIPIMYLQRPKWIKDDDKWEQLCKSVRLLIPLDFELN